jgi:hypothetical protein
MALIAATAGLGAVPAHAGAGAGPPGRSGTRPRQSYRSLDAGQSSFSRSATPNALPFLSPSRASGRVAANGAPVLSSHAATAVSPKSAVAGATLERTAAFEGTSYFSDPTPLTPPNTQVAVGSTYVVEALNDDIAVWSRTGDLVQSTDPNSFFAVPAGYRFAEPRLVYDVMSQRWFISGWASDSTNDSIVYVAVSAAADPTARWSVYRLASTTGTLTDQPKIGVSDDKLVVTWNDFANGSTFSGQETWVVQKSDLLAGGSIRYYTFLPDPSRFNIVPVITMTASATEFLAYNNTCGQSTGTGSGSCTAGSPTLGLVSLTGTPADSTVAWNESDPAMKPTAVPPPAEQRTGGVLDTGDDRLETAVWQNGTLWATANDACDPGGATHSCLRLIEVTTGTATVVQDADLALAGNDLYYPAITLDRSGNPFVVASVSSSSLDPGVIVYGRSPTSGGFVHRSLWPGAGGYTCSFCGTRGNRWGDYSSAAIDPTNPDDVWVAGEYGTANAGDDWGTAIGLVTFAAPTVTGINPARGAGTGGTQVTVHGTGFTPNASVRFGAVPATSVSVTSSTALVATAPAARSGPVDVTVTTADGTSPTSSADTFDVAGAPPPPPGSTAGGYWMVGASGTVYAFGGVRSYGRASTLGVTHIEPAPTGRGYWIVNAAGKVFAFGQAQWHGNAGALFAGETVRSLSATPTGAGYWLFTTRGRVLPFGDARFYGDMSRVDLNGPVIGSIVTATGHGYYLVASDGGIFTFGDARFYGSTGGRRLNQPVIGLVPTAGNRGYWLVAADGGTFTFGDAHFHGSAGRLTLNRPIIGMVRYGNGYLMVASDGGIFDFSNRPFAGSLGSDPPAVPIVGVAATP